MNDKREQEETFRQIISREVVDEFLRSQQICVRGGFERIDGFAQMQAAEMVHCTEAAFLQLPLYAMREREAEHAHKVEVQLQLAT